MDQATTAYRVRLDAKRRPTLPARLLEEAGIKPGEELSAKAEGKGRIVLEEPAVALEGIQAAIAAGKRPGRRQRPLTKELLAERSADTSLA